MQSSEPVHPLPNVNVTRTGTDGSDGRSDGPTEAGETNGTDAADDTDDEPIPRNDEGVP